MAVDGSANLQFIKEVAHSIGASLSGDCVIVTKSTVPVGTGAFVEKWISDTACDRSCKFAVVSNPEFLKEGSAVEDFLHPDRIVVGADEPSVYVSLRALYQPLIERGVPFLAMSRASAEMTKYAANAMLATKISFINEIANICEYVAADVKVVAQAVGLDQRIGAAFLKAGVGYGGSCFPKDVRALSSTARSFGYQATLLDVVDAVNARQRKVVAEKITAWVALNDIVLGELRVAIWGLSFKPNTDDIRESPGMDLMKWLVQQGAHVYIHDPKSLGTVQRLIQDSGKIVYCDTPYEATDAADILCLMTDWPLYADPDWERLKNGLNLLTIFDGRNQYDANAVRAAGMKYFGIGVPGKEMSRVV